jgi:hypothetical protein
MGTFSLRVAHHLSQQARPGRQVSTSATLPSGPRQFWVWVHHTKPSLIDGIDASAGDRSISRNIPFERSRRH